ncbi:hypothetical protein CHS0354_019309 [Potamilus streckersoni]|uniref:Uncharacterized protein n=1 Tax=Potamilus streckersoni TaxID=2493646 RepID=A0AAE0SHW7_9BIVA|nr:hypothetical protein CHS0354_019309 [Potamilus streckersoni]
MQFIIQHLNNAHWSVAITEETLLDLHQLFTFYRKCGRALCMDVLIQVYDFYHSIGIITGSKHLRWILISISVTLVVVIIVGIILFSRKERIKPQVELQRDKNSYETTVNPMYGLNPDDPRRLGRSLVSYKGERPFHLNSTVREKRLIFYPEMSGISCTEALKNDKIERQVPASCCYGEVQGNCCTDITRVHHSSSAVHSSYRNDTYLDMTSGCLNKVPGESKNPTNNDQLHRLGKFDVLPEGFCSKDWDMILENNDTFVDKGIELDFGLERMQGEVAQLYQEMKLTVRKPDIKDDNYMHCIPGPDHALLD